jgi:hypothetical protein
LFPSLQIYALSGYAFFVVAVNDFKFHATVQAFKKEVRVTAFIKNPNKFFFSIYYLTNINKHFINSLIEV